MAFRAEKIVAALPSVLIPDTIYCVRAASGFDLYVSDLTGTVAHPVNTGLRVQDSYRVHLVSDSRWSTESDDQFGTNTQNANENAGTAAEPNYEWEHMGQFIRAGQRVKSVDMIGRISDRNNQSDLRLIGVFRNPTSATAWQDGVDSDNEMTVTELFRDHWINATGAGQVPFTNAVNDQYKRTFVFDFVAPVDGWLSIYHKPNARPAGADAGTDYFFCTRVWNG